MKDTNQIIGETIANYRDGVFNPVAAREKYLLSGKHRRTNIWRWVAAAAAIAGVILIPLLNGSGSSVEYVAEGTHRTLILPDRTSVILSEGSVLSYNGKKFSGERSVSLEGRAIFTVTHNPSNPFTVSVGNAIIRDEGTEFQIDGNGSAIEVNVFSGKVFFADAGNRDGGLSLTAGMNARMDKGANIPEIGKSDFLNPKAWSDGHFTYENTALADVLTDLEHCFGVELTASVTAGKVLTGSFEASGLEEIIRIIGRALDVEIKLVAE